VIAAHFDECDRVGQIILRPNRSWTWRSNTYFLGTLFTVSLIVATSFALRGYWMVLPFSALEMTALLACLYYCVRRTHEQEVLTFSVDELIVEKGIAHPSTPIASRASSRAFTSSPHASLVPGPYRSADA
jgi:uncharacterized membrane protein